MSEFHQPLSTIDELADYLQVKRSWIYNRTRRNGPERVPHIKMGKYLRFDVESKAFQEWLRQHHVDVCVG